MFGRRQEVGLAIHMEQQLIDVGALHDIEQGFVFGRSLGILPACPDGLAVLDLHEPVVARPGCWR